MVFMSSRFCTPWTGDWEMLVGVWMSRKHMYVPESYFNGALSVTLDSTRRYHVQLRAQGWLSPVRIREAIIYGPGSGKCDVIA